MARGGARPGAGRKRGAAEERTREIANKAAAEGITPLEYLLAQMRKDYPEDADAATKARFDSLRFEAAKAAAPYMHPRLNAIEHTGKDGGPIQAEVLSPYEEARLIMFALEQGIRAGAKDKKKAA